MNKTTDTYLVSDFIDEAMEKGKRITKLPNHEGVYKSQTVSGQRELLREYRNKLNELIDHVNALEDRKF